MLQSWNWFAISLLEKDEGICRITAHSFVVLVTNTHRRTSCLHAWDPAAHLRFIDLVSLKDWTDIGVRSWQVSAVHLWNSLPADILLTGATHGWCAKCAMPCTLTII